MAQKFLLKDKPKVLIKKYHKILKKAGFSVEKIILFGSWAKGTPKEWSDLDLCIVSKQFGKDPVEEMMTLGKLTLQIDSMIEPHPYTPHDLTDPYDPLATEIRKTGIVFNFN